MRIVHAAIFNTFKYGTDFYSTDRKITHGLIRNGHFVYEFSYRDICRSENLFHTSKLGIGKANKKLFEACRIVRPDLLLLGHAELIRTETLHALKRALPGMKIAQWYVDPLFPPGPPPHLIDKMAIIDVFFATTGGDHLKRLKRSRNRVSYIPNISDRAVDTHQNFKSDSLDLDFIYCGRDDEQGRKEFLIELFGSIDPKIRRKIGGSLGNPLILGHDYFHLLSRAKMALNLSRRNDVYLYTSDRIVQLTGSGILTFSPEVPGMKQIYSDSEVIYFSSLTDLIEKIGRYHADEVNRKRVAENGWKKTHFSYNSERVTRFMLELIWGETFSEPYEWDTEVY